MKIFIVLSAIMAVSLAKPGYFSSSLTYASTPLTYSVPIAYAKLVPGAPTGLDGRVVDTPEVSYAKAEHAAAHINEKITLANEAAKSADYITYAAPSVAAAPLVATSYAAAPSVATAPLVATTYGAAPSVAAAPLIATTYGAAPSVATAPLVATTYGAAPALTLTKYTAGGAPIGLDGRVVDTPEVSYAKAEHAAAHINEKLEHSQKALNSVNYVTYSAAPKIASTPLVASTYAAPALTLTKYTAGGAPIGLDGRVVDTPEVSYAKAEHAAAHINHNIEHGQEFVRNSLYNSSPLLVSSYASPAYATGYLQNYW